MTLLKFGFVIICALYISQVQSTTAVDNLGISPLANTTEILIKDITKLLGVVIDDVQKLTTNLSTGGLDDFQKRTVNVTFTVLAGVKKYLDGELDRIYPQLNTNAQKVSTCVKTHGKDLISVIVSFYDKTSVCFNPSFKPLLGSLGPILTDLKELDTTVAALAPSLEGCQNNLCVLGVLAKVFQKVLTIPDILRKDLPPIIPLIKTFVNTAIDCAKKEVEPWRKDFIRMFNEGSTCCRS